MRFLNYGRGRSGGGFGGRWIIAAVIAGIGIITYLSRTQTNPVTGEKQRVALSVDQEKALGLQSVDQMVAEMGARKVDPRTDPRAALVHQVGHKLVNSSDAAKSPYVGNFNFYLLEDEMINAFALPGGQIFITTALFDQLENEAQLAGVLGHEIGHVIHRHSAEHMAKAGLGQSIVGAVAVGASGEDGAGRMAGMAAAMANQMLQLKYGRQDETESDTTGIDYMVDAGYDPRGMLGVMQVLKKASEGRGGGRQPEFMQSHPLPETRLQQIAQTIEKTYTPEQLARLTEGQPLNGAGAARLAGERQSGTGDVERRPAPRGTNGDEERW
jgi:predicted Zn-dependent protease